MPSKQATNRTVHLSDRQGILRQSTPLMASRLSNQPFRLCNQPLLGIPTVKSAVRAPQECGRAIHLTSTYFVDLFQHFDTSHEIEGVMAPMVPTNIALDGTFLNQDTRSMVDQSKVGIARPAVDGAIVLEYEDMLMGQSSKLSRS